MLPEHVDHREGRVFKSKSVLPNSIRTVRKDHKDHKEEIVTESFPAIPCCHRGAFFKARIFQGSSETL
jgi:hypothetical protein